MPNASPDVIADPERLARLRELLLLDSPADPAFDRLTRLATRILNVPISTVTLIDDHRQFFKSQIGVGEPWASLREMPLDYSYCQHVVATSSPLIVEDSRVHPLLFDNLSTLKEGLVAYAGMPLITSDGDTLGSFCVIDKKVRVWTDEELEILSDLSQAVITEIELRSELIERHKIEEALRKSEQHLQAVINNAPVIFYEIDKDGTILMTEGKGLQALNVQPNRLVGQSVFDVYADRPSVIRAIEQTLTGTPNSIVADSPSPSGLLHYEIHLSPLYDLDDNISGALGVLTDVTDMVMVEQTLEDTVARLTLLRRIEVELSESLDLNSVLEIVMDTALRASGAEHGFIGLLEADQLRLVYTVGSYVKDSVWEFGTGVVGRAMRTLEPQLVLNVDADPDFYQDIPNVRAQMVIPLIHRDHVIGVINLKTTRAKVFSDDAFEFLKLLVGHFTVAIDNAQLYQVSQDQLEELHQLYVRVSDLEQLKTDMIRLAAHDLRNPLGLVKGYADLLLMEKSQLTADQIEFAEEISSAGRKMNKIIDDILSLQRVEVAQQDKTCDEIDLTSFIRDISAGNQVRARQKNQTYQLMLPEQTVMICVDAAQLSEAIDNLIGNAIKYTPDGGSITVRLEQQPDRVIFEVEDTGLGIPEDQQERLFQPFFRASNAKSSGIEGTGLGLHLVKNIIERQGGQMRFHSTLGQGSTFGFELPLR